MTTIDPHSALAALRGRFPVLKAGHVWLVGAGPGDPGFLTLDAVAALIQADVVLHDALIDDRVLALAGPETRLEYAGKRGGRTSTRQSDISARLVMLAREGRRVVRLKGGDPFIFGRGGEEAQALAEAGVPYRIVSGVTAGIAATAAASVPATLRGVNQAVILASGHAGAEHELDWAALARTGQPLIIYMAMRNIATIVDALRNGGLSGETPAAVIVAATTPRQRIVVSRLARLADEVELLGNDVPGVIVVGEIVNARERLLGLVAEAVR